MKKELYLYSGIYSFTAEDFIRQFEENKNSDIVIRMNTNGGDPQAAWGMIAKMKEHSKDVTIKVDGKAISSGFYMLPYAKRVEALNVSSFLVHRAAYSQYYELNGMTAEERTELVKINEDLRKTLESKIDQKKFTKLTGVTFDQIFDLNSRIDVRLTSSQALEVGLVDSITNINDSKVAALGKFYFDELEVAAEEKPKEKSLNKNTTIMTIEKLKAEHPELYNSIFAAGSTSGVNKERDRVGAFMAFVDIDADAVAKGIKDGSELTATAMAEFARKGMSADGIKNIKADSSKTLTTEEVEAKEKTEKEKVVSEFEAKAKLELKK